MTDFHDRFLVIDNVELHGLGSSINCLGRRVTSYTTRDAKEIAKLLAMLPCNAMGSASKPCHVGGREMQTPAFREKHRFQKPCISW